MFTTRYRNFRFEILWHDTVLGTFDTKPQAEAFRTSLTFSRLLDLVMPKVAV